MLPITNQPIYHDILNVREEEYPNAKIINDYGFYVGCHQDLSVEDMEYVGQHIIEGIRRQGVFNENSDD
jgi:dTDP-4-amino-4,6-dideoxygalactose transaminase